MLEQDVVVSLGEIGDTGGPPCIPPIEACFLTRHFCSFFLKSGVRFSSNIFVEKLLAIFGEWVVGDSGSWGLWAETKATAKNNHMFIIQKGTTRSCGGLFGSLYTYLVSIAIFPIPCVSFRILDPVWLVVSDSDDWFPPVATQNIDVKLCVSVNSARRNLR